MKTLIVAVLGGALAGWTAARMTDHRDRARLVALISRTPRG